jgi:hypothetical protein
MTNQLIADRSTTELLRNNAENFILYSKTLALSTDLPMVHEPQLEFERFSFYFITTYENLLFIIIYIIIYR